jgi:hypothetical protein
MGREGGGVGVQIEDRGVKPEHVEIAEEEVAQRFKEGVEQADLSGHSHNHLNDWRDRLAGARYNRRHHRRFYSGRHDRHAHLGG